MRQEWYVSCQKWTVVAVTEDRIITETANITRKFVGQHLNNLIAWGEKLGGPVQVTLLPKREDMTCWACPDNTTCEWAWDVYNTNGDCLANK